VKQWESSTKLRFDPFVLVLIKYPKLVSMYLSAIAILPFEVSLSIKTTNQSITQAPMKKQLLVFPMLFAPIFGNAAHITGQFRNAAPGTVIEVLVPHRFIDGHDGHYRGILDAQSQFSIEAEMPEPQLAFLIFNDDRLPIFMADGDTVQIKGDAFQFPLAVNFSGKSGPNNRLLQSYLHQNPLDFNEFNNIRFKIGQYWTSVEMTLNDRMESLAPVEFNVYMDSLRQEAIGLLAQSVPKLNGDISEDFDRWINAEITYTWAYHLLVYGHVYAGRYDIQPEFFDFLFEAPIIGESIGSDQYRQFLLAFMARQQARTSMESEGFWAGQYHLAGKLLSGKCLAFFRSEIINIAFSVEKYRELLPLYTDFLQSNQYQAYDAKVEDLYQKYARVLPGTSAPSFETSDADGKEISLSQFQGKVVYLNFWASWCGACLRKMELMDNYQAEFDRNGIIVVNVSIDESPANWRHAMEEYKFKGRHLLASASQGRNIAAIYGVEAVPQYFIIGPKGDFFEKLSSNQPADIRQQLLRVAGKQ
jgi:thiol-disulfide isomerase/thioredoxin